MTYNLPCKLGESFTKDVKNLTCDSEDIHQQVFIQSFIKIRRYQWEALMFVPCFYSLKKPFKFFSPFHAVLFLKAPFLNSIIKSSKY